MGEDALPYAYIYNTFLHRLMCVTTQNTEDKTILLNNQIAQKSENFTLQEFKSQRFHQ